LASVNPACLNLITTAMIFTLRLFVPTLVGFRLPRVYFGSDNFLNIIKSGVFYGTIR